MTAPTTPSRPRSWRDVPVPDTLAGRPRAPNGMPVPWAAMWSSEHETLYEAYDPALRAPALFLRGENGAGTPMLAWLSPPRQRDAMLNRRCHVCNAPVDRPWPLVDWTDSFGKRPQPWVCPPCLDYSMQVCTHLRGDPPAVFYVEEARLERSPAHDHGLTQFSPEAIALLHVEPVRFEHRPWRSSRAPATRAG